MPALLHAKPCGIAGACRRSTQRRAVVVASAQLRQGRIRSAAAAAVAASALLFGSQAASAIGIESMDLLPTTFEKPAALAKYGEEQKQKLADVDEAFEKSDTLKELLARSEANKAKNRKDVQNKYCYRQAELGVGDCGGLRYIPGLTENGKQKTPAWLAGLLGIEEPEESAETETRTLRELIYNEK